MHALADWTKRNALSTRKRGAGTLSMTILVNGGSGFIRCNFGLDWLAQSAETIPRGDAPTQAGSLHGHDEIDGDLRRTFVQCDVGDRELLEPVRGEIETTERNDPYCGKRICAVQLDALAQPMRSTVTGSTCLSRRREGVLMPIAPTALRHLLLLEPNVFADERGFFPNSCNKLAFHVAVDIRRGSPTFGRWVGVILDDANHQLMWIPADFAHAFVALEGDTHFACGTTGYHARDCERAIAWNNPPSGIDWPGLTRTPLLAANYSAAPRLAQAEPFWSIRMTQRVPVETVIIPGGSGTRLWQLSSTGYPTPSRVLTAEYRSMFQQAVQRQQRLDAADIALTPPRCANSRPVRDRCQQGKCSAGRRPTDSPLPHAGSRQRYGKQHRRRRLSCEQYQNTPRLVISDDARSGRAPGAFSVFRKFLLQTGGADFIRRSEGNAQHHLGWVNVSLHVLNITSLLSQPSSEQAPVTTR